MRGPRLALAGAIAGVTAAIAAGCSLGWEVRPDPGEAGAPDTSVLDVALTESGTDAPGDVGADVVEADADPCAARRAAVAKARAGARKCTFPSATQCKVTVKDECDCDVIVASAASAETTLYSEAVAAFLADACAPSPACASCPLLGSMTAWSCVSTNSCLP